MSRGRISPPPRLCSQCKEEIRRYPTAREIEIVKLLVLSIPVRKVAKRLGITPRTVSKHKANAMEKLGLRNSYQITAWAIAAGHLDAQAVLEAQIVMPARS